MATYFMFGKYSLESVKDISPERTVKAAALITKYGGEVKSGYALLGEKDLVLIVDLPDLERAMKTSVALTKLLGISFTTTPAVTVEDFDKIMGEL
ncbi:MAG: GYD domain-containing protein [Anaerolineales bacterium]|nr:GYD domain-containing protein [Anaerolineales bacterium]